MMNPLSKAPSNPPNPIRVIENQSKTFIDISDTPSSHNKLSPCVWNESPRASEPFRGYLIQNCHHCTIVVRMKIIQLTLIDCSHCHIHIYAPLIHSMDIIRCSNIKGSHLYCIPVVHWDKCNDVIWNQYVSSTIYRLTHTPEVYVCLRDKHDQTFHLQSNWLENETWFSVDVDTGCSRYKYDNDNEYTAQTEMFVLDQEPRDDNDWNPLFEP